jgi:hypothetical protein
MQGTAMPDVFRFFQIRPPQKAPVQQIVSRGISTHVAALAGTVGGSAQQGINPPFLLAMAGATIATGQPNGTGTARPIAPFHDALRAAYEAHDVDQFIRVASDYYLNSAIRKLSDVHPVGQAAYALFEGMGPIMQKVAVNRFFAQHTESDVITYLRNDFFGEVGRVNDTILAMEALRLHGSHDGLAPTRLLKALYGLYLAHALHAHDPEQWSLAPLTRLFEMPVFVPGWVWQFDPCDWLMSKGPGGTAGAVPPPQGDAAELATSPFIEMTRAVALYREAQNRPPHDELCSCKCDDRCVPQSPCCAEAKSFITDLLVVRETLQCYVPSDIAYIENVLAGEKRTRKHESLLQIEQKQETETTVTSSEERDHQVSERFALSTQADKTTQEDSQLDAGVTTNQKWGTGEATITANASFGTSTSTSEQVARNYARDVVDRSVSKIEKNVRQLVSRSVLSKTREVNKHVLDRTGQTLTVGIYTWVSKTLKAQVFGYGRRMVYEFILPDPAALYKALLIKAFGLDEKFTGGNPPVAPPRASDITEANYLGLADIYGVDDAPAPPDTTKNIVLRIGGTPGPEYRLWLGGPWRYSGAHSTSGTISVPAGYATTSMSGSPGAAPNGHDPGTASLKILIGQYSLNWYLYGAGADVSSAPLPGLEGQLLVDFNAFNLTYYNPTLTVVCTVKANVLHAWQSAVHHLLVDAYQKQKEAYDAALAAFQAAQAEKKKEMLDSIHNRAPFFNREIERTELKRLAISWLSCQHFDRFNAMKRRVQPCGLPQMNLHEAEEQGKIIRFWEQAFDWNLMTYLFYPYFWSAKCAWADKIVEDTGDGLFDKFMQAGAARVQVPVAEGFEDHMLYWENTGQIWGQVGEPPISDTDPHWISMVQEIKHQQDCYLNDREGRIDTNPPSNIVTIKGSDRYWDPVLAVVDPNAVAMDLDREIAIDTVVYRIVAIAPDPNSPNFDVLHPNLMWWTVTLDRPYESAVANGLPYAVGAKFVGAPWMVTVPTNIIWLKNDTYCLPCYPLTCKGE